MQQLRKVAQKKLLMKFKVQFVSAVLKALNSRKQWRNQTNTVFLPNAKKISRLPNLNL
jgi:hypothetical protein